MALANFCQRFLIKWKIYEYTGEITKPKAGTKSGNVIGLGLAPTQTNRSSDSRYWTP